MTIYGMKSIYPVTSVKLDAHEPTFKDIVTALWRQEIKPALLYALAFAAGFMLITVLCACAPKRVIKEPFEPASLSIVVEDGNTIATREAMEMRNK